MIIESLLDTDLYKFTMMQVVLHHFPGAQVEYRFKCRNAGVDLPPYVGEIEDGDPRACAACASRSDELDYLRRWRFFKSDFVDLLELFHLDERFVQRRARSARQRRDRHHDQGAVAAHDPVRGAGARDRVARSTTATTHPQPDFAEGRRRLAPRSRRSTPSTDPDFRIADYGTRRRFSAPGRTRWCARSSAASARSSSARATSSSRCEHGLTPLGTMAHEYLQACQAVGPRLRDSQVFAFNTWAREYRGDLGIALSDVCGMDAFLRDFDLFFCKLFDGVRHDSGDPFEWGEKLIAHYQKMRIDPRTQDDGVLRQPQRAARHPAVRIFQAAAARRRSASAPTSPTTSATSRCRS